MGRTRHTAEQIIAKLREAEIELAKGQKTAEVIRATQGREEPRSGGSLAGFFSPVAHRSSPFLGSV